jgi:hypothetical protein
MKKETKIVLAVGAVAVLLVVLYERKKKSGSGDLASSYQSVLLSPPFQQDFAHATQVGPIESLHRSGGFVSPTLLGKVNS